MKFWFLLLVPFLLGTTPAKTDKTKEGSCHDLMKKTPYTIVLQPIPSLTFRQPIAMTLPFAFEYRGSCLESDKRFLAYSVLADDERKKRIKKYCDELNKQKDTDKPTFAVEFCKKHGG